MKERDLRKRFACWVERYNQRTKELRPLHVGDRCFIQNQEGVRRKKWDRSGLVVDVLEHDKYLIKIDGSGRLTKRNRRFLRFYKPSALILDSVPVSVSSEELGGRGCADQPRERELRSGTGPESTGQEGFANHGNEPAEDFNTPIDFSDPIDDNSLEKDHSTPCESTGIKERLALPLRRLQPHNAPGLKEDLDPVRTRLRNR